jgi:hypothetical protein
VTRPLVMLMAMDPIVFPSLPSLTKRPGTKSVTRTSTYLDPERSRVLPRGLFESVRVNIPSRQQLEAAGGQERGGELQGL